MDASPFRSDLVRRALRSGLREAERRISMKTIRILTVAALIAACGGGGGGGGSGTIGIQNTSSNWSYGECGLQVSISPVSGSSSRFENLDPCEFRAVTLSPGQYNVEARGTSACQGAYRQTVTVKKGENTPLFFSCSACRSC
jgi:hypothetical protein